MINILHISSPITWRGGERQIANLMLALREKNCNQLLLCPTATPLADFCKENKFNFYALKKANGFSLKWVKEITKICKKENISHIHVHDSKSHTYAITATALYNNSPKIIVSRRVIFPIKNKWFTKYKYKHPKIDTIICLSKAVEKIILQAIPEARTTIIPSSINTQKFDSIQVTNSLRNQFNIPKNHSIIAYVAALSNEKDHITFIKTAKQILKEKNDVIFLIIGEGKERERIEESIANYDLQDKIFLTGFIKDIDSIVPQLDVLLFTSVSEGLGSTILDFFLAKIPVVTTRCGGVEELVFHQKTGLLSNVGDYKDLSKNVLRFLSDSDLKEKITKNAYNYIVKEHSIQQLGDKTFTIYKDYPSPKAEASRNKAVETYVSTKLTPNKITAIIPTLNEEGNIAEAIATLDFADEIILIDSQSSDNTVARAKELKAKVIVRKFDDFSTQKTFAIEQAKNDWIYILDADERVGNNLKNEILSSLENNQNDVAFPVKMKYYFMGKHMKFGSFRTKKVTRLFNRKFCKYDGKPVHEQLLVNGKQKMLMNYLDHKSNKTLNDFIQTQNFYATLKAKELFSKNDQFTHVKALIKPPYRFFKHYIIQLGFLDGFQGLVFAGIQSYGVFIRYVKLWFLKYRK